MSRVSYNDLLEAGAHFGHLKSKWNPKMAPYIFMEARGIHIIDLNKTVAKIDEAAAAMKQVAKSGKKILFVATKKQAKDIVADAAGKVNMPFITERWPGGMLTNFATVRKSVKKMTGFDKMATDGTFENISKKERLQITRQKAKMEKFLGSIVDLSRLPAALFIIDINKEHIAVAEAKKLNIPTFAITDTNTDPTQVDFAIPANDDATKSIALIVETMTKAIEEGLSERKMDKEAEKDREDEGTAEEAGITVEYVGADDSDDDDDSKPSKKTAEIKKPGAPRRRTTTSKKSSE
ncbi:MAG TPA: 30S ribosomal protein S2 [Bacteroidia bacterium]|nr:30S ribosomal protein S2 [Bacteroidia bacterium]